MAIRRASKSSISTTSSGKRFNLIAGYSPAVDEMDLIQRVTVGSGGVSSITFSNIPQTYQHLQIRGIGMDARTATSSDVHVRFNSDSGSNYASHYFYGNGTSVSSSGVANTTRGTFLCGASGTAFGSSIVEIMDYKNTSKFKTAWSFSGVDKNGSGDIMLSSWLWRSNDAINSISLTPIVPNFAQYTTYALYGVVG